MHLCGASLQQYKSVILILSCHSKSVHLWGASLQLYLLTTIFLSLDIITTILLLIYYGCFYYMFFSSHECAPVWGLSYLPEIASSYIFLSLDIVLYNSIFAIYLLLSSVKECAPGWGLSYPARIWCVCVYIVNNSSSCILYYCKSSDRTIHYRNMCYLILFTIHII